MTQTDKAKKAEMRHAKNDAQLAATDFGRRAVEIGMASKKQPLPFYKQVVAGGTAGIGACVE